MEPKLVFCDEICGSEFDWYAVDLAGNYALFSTAGSGMIPNCITCFIDEYCISVPSATQGNDPWRPLASAGLFVFDHCNSMDYMKKADAVGAPSAKLQNELDSLPNLLLFYGCFSEMQCIADLSEFLLKDK